MASASVAYTMPDILPSPFNALTPAGVLELENLFTQHRKGLGLRSGSVNQLWISITTTYAKNLLDGNMGGENGDAFNKFLREKCPTIVAGVDAVLKALGGGSIVVQELTEKFAKTDIDPESTTMAAIKGVFERMDLDPNATRLSYDDCALEEAERVFNEKFNEKTVQAQNFLTEPQGAHVFYGCVENSSTSDLESIISQDSGCGDLEFDEDTQMDWD